jgi:hypothetical protein
VIEGLGALKVVGVPARGCTPCPSVPRGPNWRLGAFDIPSSYAVNRWGNVIDHPNSPAIGPCFGVS